MAEAHTANVILIHSVKSQIWNYIMKHAWDI